MDNDTFPQQLEIVVRQSGLTVASLQKLREALVTWTDGWREMVMTMRLQLAKIDLHDRTMARIRANDERQPWERV